MLFIKSVAALRKEKENDRKTEREKGRERKKMERARFILIINARSVFSFVLEKTAPP